MLRICAQEYLLGSAPGFLPPTMHLRNQTNMMLVSETRKILPVQQRHTVASNLLWWSSENLHQYQEADQEKLQQAGSTFPARYVHNHYLLGGQEWLNCFLDVLISTDVTFDSKRHGNADLSNIVMPTAGAPKR